MFTRTKQSADSCATRLKDAGVKADSIHADKHQGKRDRALKNFRDGKIDVLVATDVLARGIDITDVSYVVNLTVPDSPEDYIHRIGRTGRAGESGPPIRSFPQISFLTCAKLNIIRSICLKLTTSKASSMPTIAWSPTPSVPPNAHHALAGVAGGHRSVGANSSFALMGIELKLFSKKMLHRIPRCV